MKKETFVVQICVRKKKTWYNEISIETILKLSIPCNLDQCTQSNAPIKCTILNTYKY